MKITISRAFVTAIPVAVLAVVPALLPASAADGGRPFDVAMTGAEEAPGPGDPDGSGTFTATVNPGQSELCYTLEVANVDNVTAAHVHRAPAGQAGGVVIPLVAPFTGSSAACATVDRTLAAEIAAHPERFYANVHSQEFPAGAVRGQLG